MSTIQLVRTKQKDQPANLETKQESGCNTFSVTKLPNSKIKAEDIVGLTWIFFDELEMISAQKNFSSVIAK